MGWIYYWFGRIDRWWNQSAKNRNEMYVRGYQGAPRK